MSVHDGYRVAIVGATGAVGETVLRVLDESSYRDFPIKELVPFASERSAGKQVRFRGDSIPCRVLDEDNVDGFDLVISSAGGSVSDMWAERFADTGALVIDKSSAWRAKDEVPLIVAGVNNHRLEDALPGKGIGIIASPNCSTMQMVVALNPIYREVGLEEIVVSTYQSVSGTGKLAVEELREQTQAVLEGSGHTPHVYPHQIAFNALPHVEDFDLGNGYTGEETKLMRETRKILDVERDEDLPISATCVRVPVFTAHSEAVRIRTRAPLSAERCRALLRATDGVVVRDDPEHAEYPLATDAADNDNVFVGRIRNDLVGPDRDRCLNMWIVGDNLRKGAATNAVQIAQLLDSKGLLGRDASAARAKRHVTAAV